MRHIHKTVQRVKEQDINRVAKNDTSQSSEIRGDKTKLVLPQFDAALGFLNPPNPPVYSINA